MHRLRSGYPLLDRRAKCYLLQVRTGAADAAEQKRTRKVRAVVSMNLTTLHLSKTKLDYIIASVSAAHAHSFFGADEADRIKTHGAKYLFWKGLMQELEGASDQKGLEQWS